MNFQALAIKVLQAQDLLLGILSVLVLTTTTTEQLGVHQLNLWQSLAAIASLPEDDFGYEHPHERLLGITNRTQKTKCRQKVNCTAAS